MAANDSNIHVSLLINAVFKTQRIYRETSVLKSFFGRPATLLKRDCNTGVLL